jgi:glycosidase
MRKNDYFPYDIQISEVQWDRLGLGKVRAELRALGEVPDVVFLRHTAARMNRMAEPGTRPAHARLMNLYALLTRIERYVVDNYAETMHPGILGRAEDDARRQTSAEDVTSAQQGFARYFPPVTVLDGVEPPQDYLAPREDAARRRDRMVREFLLLRVAAENPAVDDFRVLLDDGRMAAATPFRKVARALETSLRRAPALGPLGMTLPDLLRAPILASPHSLEGQVEYVRDHWQGILPPELLREILTAFEMIREEEREWGGGTAGPPQVLEFGGRDALAGYPEVEAFSRDADWMSNVVLIAKMVYVWLDQLTKRYGRPIQRLDEVPDDELDRLARWGFTGLWLIGQWERSPASQRIKQIAGNPDAIASAYSLYDYQVAWDLGGEEALANLKERLARRGIRLASDMVPNHTGIYSRWTVEHPEWYVQLDYPPYPAYQFTGPDLSFDGRVSMRIEDGYWEKRDAAVVFQHVDNQTGRVRYIYHGNDGTSTPWNDTAQLNYLLPEVREAVIQTILQVARRSPIIRFDAAMTLAKKHYQRLWFPQPDQPSGVPSRAEHGMTRAEFDHVFPIEFWRQVVDRVAAEAPDTLLLAEAFWLMEGYFVRTLGMHRVYNSAFMNMLKLEDNANYRLTIKNVLEFNPEILKRFVNFMNNPDELTAVEQFGKEGKYIGAAVLLVTMPGLPMFGHGQIEGFHEKYGMEYRRARWDEPIDEHLVHQHESCIFPLMRKRYLFSGSENFAFYDFFAGDSVNEDVFAYSNRAGDERGLILYHNRYATTSGWIRTSTAVSRKNAGGDAALVQTSLGDALGFNPDGRFYYAFKDWGSGEEFLRSGRELVEKGLFVELGAYEYKAFLDFREIRDDDFGTWGRLHHRLGGAPVVSLDDEIKIVRYEPVHVALAAFHEEARDALAAMFDATAKPAARRAAAGPVAGRARELRAALAAQRGVPSDAAAEAVGAEAFTARLDAALAPIEPAGTEPERLLLLTWLAIVTSTGSAEDEAPAVPATWLDELGLSRAIDLAGARGAHLAGSVLLKILLANRRLLGDLTGADLASGMARLFADATARTAMGVHASDGVEWFHQESFAEVVRWLWLATRVDAGRLPGPGDDVAVDGILEAARVAGFRSDRFLAALDGAVARPGEVG